MVIRASDLQGDKGTINAQFRRKLPIKYIRFLICRRIKDGNNENNQKQKKQKKCGLGHQISKVMRVTSMNNSDANYPLNHSDSSFADLNRNQNRKSERKKEGTRIHT